jgi:hypothetical protein
VTDIIELDPAHEDAYREFLCEAPQATVYASLEYRQFLQAVVSGIPRYLLAMSGSRVVGVFPLFVMDVPGFGTLVNSLPWYGSHGGCVLGADGPDEVRRALIAAYRHRILRCDPLSATVVLLPSEQPHLETYRELLRPESEDARVGQMTVLPEPGPDLEMRLQGSFMKKTRNLVRKALKQGLERREADDEEGWAFLHATHQENLRAMGGRAKPWAHFVALRSQLPASWRGLHVATLHGRPVAALLLLRFQRTIEYITPVVVESFRSVQPLSFLIYHAMLDGVTAGFREWNWGGTWRSQASLYHFKSGWGASDLPYTYLVNSADRGARLRQFRDQLSSVFPYYYAYPYDQMA